ncbi:Alternative dihydrofolate reductase 3 [hydrothermal vent metagenome]|uniref:Alternative dihydrofolate reductase 3 n=1 Tax=hydrothermal vent metagenome TaxID=652676 RepID=A0A3B1C6M9_9ZZZZ
MKIITGKEETTQNAKINAIIAFYRVFRSRNLAEMAHVWAQSEQVLMANPLGGIKIGWPEIRAVYARIFEGPTQVEIVFQDYNIISSGEMFVVTGREMGRVFRGTNKIDLKIRTSRVFQLIDGQWRQVTHHGSIDDPEMLKSYQALVAHSK